MIGVLVLLLIKKKNGYLEYMMLVGMLTAYFDYFSIPFVTWGGLTLIILIAYCKDFVGKQINIVWNTSIGWIIGYGGAILVKPLLSVLIIGKEALFSTMERVKMETGGKDNAVWEAIAKLVGRLRPFVRMDIATSLVLIFMIFVVIFFSLILGFKNRELCCNNILVCIVSLAPFFWFYVFRGHIHHGFDYRILFISVFGGFILIMRCLQFVSNIIYNKLKDFYL